MLTSLNVNLKKVVDDSYKINIGQNFLKNFEVRDSIFYVIDKNVYELHNKIMPKENFYLFEASEHNKNMDETVKILSFIKKNKGIRSSKLIAIGGGITGDITAFAASIYMRGIKCEQIPTTLLSMVDSSVGGKCGINFGGIKNFVGSFWQPDSVNIDINFLQTLPDDEFYSGLSEVIKMALTFNKDFTYYIMDNAEKIKERQSDVLIELIFNSCKIKSNVVMQDEKEKGLRRLLNFGHTFGHAIETDSNHQIKHGIAVAKGMYYETLFAANNGLIDKNVVNIVKNILEKFDYDLQYSITNKDLFFKSLSEDKKMLNSGLVLSLTDGLGSGKIVEKIKIEDIVSFFKCAHRNKP